MGEQKIVKTKKEYYEYYKKIIENNGGTVLSDKYINTNVKFDVLCTNGHLIQRRPIKFVDGIKCIKCRCENQQNEWYEYYKKIVESYGGTIISDKYNGATTNIEVLCIKGHLVQKRPYRFVDGIGCIKCRRNDQTNKWYEYYKNIIEKTGGQMLSKKYTNYNTQLEFYCKNNHLNKKLPEKIKNGIKCCECIRINKYNDEYYKERLEVFNKIIKQKNGVLLSNTYIDYNTKLDIICINNHKFSLLPNHLTSGIWCIKCHRYNIRINTFNKYKKMIEEYGGICITTIETYSSSNTRITWKCKECHVQKTKPWEFTKSCNHCVICCNNVKLTLEQMQEIAIQREGKCLSDKYINGKTKLLWECANRHQWLAAPMYVKNKTTWCPVCNNHIKEQICRQIFEKIFNDKKFTSIRPKWLMGKKGYPLELDGYNEQLKLGFEYNGEQHYKSIPIFKNNLKEQQARDKLKVLICKEKGVNLIVIPYTIKPENFQEFIINRCNELNIKIPNKEKINIDDLKIDYKNRLNELRQIIEAKGGKLLSKSYMGIDKKIKVECKKGHIWHPTAHSIKRGHWCRKCLYNID
uniref:Uncharacterized protein n=1 Tax=Mimivirus LCMiAC01 TaxID=2506608 RepID=A0A481Z0R9_9VIRU|nr:MAG: hypothetical protein LCMiAC01_00480 [Mimivirus LCMiAC01]